MSLTNFDDTEERLLSERIRRAHSDRERKKEMRHRERHVVKDIGANQATELISAKILRTEGAYFAAERADGQEMRVRSVKSTVSGNPNSTLVAVGDQVRIEPGTGEIGVIREVLPRTTKLARKAHKKRAAFEQVIVSNVDLVAIVSSAGEPPMRPGVVDRYLVAAHEGGLGALVIVNKSDELIESNERGEFVIELLEYYRSIGYPISIVSAQTGDCIDELRDMISGKTIVFAGKSGVGKSSLVNAIMGEEIARTRGLMKKAARGVHTTTNAMMIPLPDGGYIVDTPGVKEFFHFELEADQIRFHFVEFEPLQDKCKMTNCLHVHEPGCAVSEAVDDGVIPEWRYNSYVAMWEEAERERKERINGM